MKELKKLILPDKMAHLTRYQGGNLMYRVGSFEFPIPIEDTGNGIFEAEMKAITLMRWIRKHLALIKENDAR